MEQPPTPHQQSREFYSPYRPTGLPKFIETEEGRYKEAIHWILLQCKQEVQKKAANLESIGINVLPPFIVEFFPKVPKANAFPTISDDKIPNTSQEITNEHAVIATQMIDTLTGAGDTSKGEDEI